MRLSLWLGAALLLMYAPLSAGAVESDPLPVATRIRDEIAKLLATVDGAKLLSLPDAIDLSIHGSQTMGIPANHGIEAIRDQLHYFAAQNLGSKVSGGVVGSAGYSRGGLFEVSNPGSVASGFAPYNNSLSLGYGLSLQSFLQGWFKGDQLEHQAKSTLNLAQSENVLALAVTESYMQLVASLSHLKAYLEITQDYLKLESVAGGAENRATSDLIVGDLQKIEANVVDIQNLRAQALQSLKGLMQVPLADGSDSKSKLLFTFTAVEQLALTIPETEEATARELLDNGPQMELLREAVDAAKSTRSSDRAALLPDLNYNETVANLSSMDGGANYRERKRNDVVALTLPINPGQWVRARGDTWLVRAKEESLAQKKNDSLSDIRNAWIQAELYKRSFDIQSRNFRVAQDRYLCAMDYYPTLGQAVDPRVVDAQLNNMLTALDSLYVAGTQWVDEKAVIRNALGTLTKVETTEQAVAPDVKPETMDLSKLCGKR